MKYFSIIEPTTEESIQASAETPEMEQKMLQNPHPQEDYLATSLDPPVFVVADGVTLYEYDEEKDYSVLEDYTHPSPSGEVASLFCEKIVELAKKHYSDLEEGVMNELFEESNEEVRVFNMRFGKSNIAGNKTGYFAATAAYVVIKNKKAHWGAIGDSGLLHLNKNGEVVFKANGKVEEYAVVNGEREMCNRLQTGVFEIDEGDYIFLHTDGFEPYVKRQDFLDIFMNREESLESRVRNYTSTMNIKNPKKYGRERSLIAVRIG